MGIGSIWHWLVLLLIVMLLFGTKRLKTLGGDLGESIKNFKKSMGEAEKEPDAPKKIETGTERIIEGELKERDKV
ncbi:MAG: twin-arginine translocase TatA/TatE family subunit [Thiotrichales bacterium]